MLQTKQNTKVSVFGPSGPQFITVAELLALPDAVVEKPTPDPVVVVPDPVIVPPIAGFSKGATLADQKATLGVDFSFTIPADAFTANPKSLDVSDLPPGLRWDSGTRTISGTPSKTDRRLITISAQSEAGAKATNSFWLAVLANSTATDTETQAPKRNTEWEYDNANSQI